MLPRKRAEAATALHEVHEQRRDLETALHKALEGEQFVLHFQPKVCSHTRAIVGREALIRWNRPGRGMVYPDNFIPVAEQSLLINDIGRWTIRAACEAAGFTALIEKPIRPRALVATLADVLMADEDTGWELGAKRA